ncbi:MAG: Crp/Fnr family transcriptional regulator [Beijerinckiaceae bacterium]
MFKDEIASLQCNPMFKEIDSAKLKLIALTSTRTSYTAGDVIVSQGSPCESVYFVLEGTASVVRQEGHKQVLIAELAKGAIFGEIGALLNRSYSSMMVAKTDVCVLALEKQIFFDLLNKVPQFSMALMRIMAKRVLDLRSRYVEAQIK